MKFNSGMRHSPKDLREAFRLFGLATDEERKRFRDLAKLGEMNERLGGGQLDLLKGDG